MTVLALITMAALWDNGTVLSPMAAPTATATPEDTIPDRRGMSPWPNLFKPCLRSSQVSAGRDSDHLPPHLPVSSFALLGISLLFVPPRVSQCLRFFCAVCLCADPILLPTSLVGAWASSWSNAPAKVPPQWDCGSCSVPGRAGWQQAEGGPDLHSFASTSKGGIETTTSDAWQEKKELNAEFYPPLILLSKFVEESCSFSQGKSASLTDWHCLCWNRLLKKQISLQKNVSASTRNNRKSKWA